jgi:hypothetical protein
VGESGVVLLLAGLLYFISTAGGLCVVWVRTWKRGCDMRIRPKCLNTTYFGVPQWGLGTASSSFSIFIYSICNGLKLRSRGKNTTAGT